MIFNVKFGALFLQENVITNLKVSRLSPLNFRKIIDFWFINQNFQKTLHIKYHFRRFPNFLVL